MALGFYAKQARSMPYALRRVRAMQLRCRTSAQIAQRGMIALALAQSPEFVAPFGAAAALYGTNPIGAPKQGIAP